MARRGIRGIIASMFVIGSAAVGIGVSAGVAAGGGNGHGDKNCKVPFQFMPREVTAEFQYEMPKFKPAHCEELEVTKVVTGTPQAAPPPGTQFSVVVECIKHENNSEQQDDILASSQFNDWQDWIDSLPEGNKPPFTTTLTFGPEGGTESILVAAKHESECTVTEQPPPGCTLTSIEPATTTIGGHSDANASTVEEREPVVHEVTVTNNCNPPVQPAAAAASVVVVQPRFTG
jgi:hypothetical protein